MRRGFYAPGPEPVKTVMTGTDSAKKIKNEKMKMAKCGAKTEVYSRVCGYFRPVANWNKGKKEEFKDRKTYAVAAGGCSKQAVA